MTKLYISTVCVLHEPITVYRAVGRNYIGDFFKDKTIAVKELLVIYSLLFIYAFNSLSTEGGGGGGGGVV